MLAQISQHGSKAVMSNNMCLIPLQQQKRRNFW